MEGLRKKKQEKKEKKQEKKRNRISPDLFAETPEKSTVDSASTIDLQATQNTVQTVQRNTKATAILRAPLSFSQTPDRRQETLVPERVTTSQFVRRGSFFPKTSAQHLEAGFRIFLRWTSNAYKVTDSSHIQFSPAVANAFVVWAERKVSLRHVRSFGPKRHSQSFHFRVQVVVRVGVHTESPKAPSYVAAYFCTPVLREGPLHPHAEIAQTIRTFLVSLWMFGFEPYRRCKCKGIFNVGGQTGNDYLHGRRCEESLIVVSGIEPTPFRCCTNNLYHRSVACFLADWLIFLLETQQAGCA